MKDRNEKAGDPRRSDRQSRTCVLLLAAALLLSTTFSAPAQQADTLRGEIDDSDLTTGAIASPSYQPFSQGALPDDGGTTAGGTATDDAGKTAAGSSATAGSAPLDRLAPLIPPSSPAPRPGGATASTAAGKATGQQTLDAASLRKLDNLRTQSIDAARSDVGRAQPENQRAQAAGGRTIKRDDDPYAPLGIRAGSFLLRPTIEQGIRATTNADVSSTGRSAVLSETTLRLNAASDWSRHQATLDASGTLVKTLTGQHVSEPQIDVIGTLRLDLADDVTVSARAAYDLQKESANTPNSVTGTASQPTVETIDASLGVERDLGLFFAKATGSYERQIYGDARLSSGGTLSQSDRDTNYAAVTLRGGINLSEAFKPFVEAEVGRLIYDEKFDTSGYQRSADRLGLRGGITFDFGEKLNGEVSAGYLAEHFDDPRLATLANPSIAANVNWSPQRGTNVALSGSTTLEGSTTAGESGSVLYASDLAVTHSLRPNLDLTVTLGAWLRDLKDTGGYDHGFSAEAETTYWFNRVVGLDTRARYEIAESDDPGRRAKAASVYVGLKFQR